MAATPPSQIRSTPRTPPTPLHGPAYDTSPQPRYPTRSGLRRTSRDYQATSTVNNTTPRASRTPLKQSRSRRSSISSTPHTAQLHSPQASTRRRPSRRVELSPPSPPAADSPAPTPTKPDISQPTFLSSTTIMSDGMLPTPVKTPRKKNVPAANAAARALFQDQPILGEEVVSSSRRGRKGRRYNGFTLESFAVDAEEGRSQIQIFTDSRDKVPQIDAAPDNPFIEEAAVELKAASKKVAGTSKRRKVSGETKNDKQVRDAINRDEGMVYVFRGKKVFRKFDDEDEEEEIDAADLGLLRNNGSNLSDIPPLKTLTRKSIKPRRLFQTEQQKLEREAEKEEEALTEIEDNAGTELIHATSPQTPTKKPETVTPVSPPQSGRALRSATKKEMADLEGSQALGVGDGQSQDPEKISPFAAWKRIKAGTGVVVAEATKGKRRAADAFEEDKASVSKKSRSH